MGNIAFSSQRQIWCERRLRKPFYSTGFQPAGLRARVAGKEFNTIALIKSWLKFGKASLKVEQSGP